MTVNHAIARISKQILTAYESTHAPSAFGVDALGLGVLLRSTAVQCIANLIRQSTLQNSRSKSSLHAVPW